MSSQHHILYIFRIYARKTNLVFLKNLEKNRVPREHSIYIRPCLHNQNQGEIMKISTRKFEKVLSQP